MLLSDEYKLLSTMVPLADGDYDFKTKDVPQELLMVLFTAKEHGLISRKSALMWHITPTGRQALYIRQQADEQAAKDAQYNAERDRKNKRLQIVIAVFGAIITIVAAVISLHS